MDYFDDVFHTFLAFDSVIYLELMVQSQATVFIQNILNCVPKMNEDLRVWNNMGVSE